MSTSPTRSNSSSGHGLATPTVWARGTYHPHYLRPDNACTGLAQLQETPSGQQRLAHLASPSSKGKSKGQKLTGQGKHIPSSKKERGGGKRVLPNPLISGVQFADMSVPASPLLEIRSRSNRCVCVWWWWAVRSKRVETQAGTAERSGSYI